MHTETFSAEEKVIKTQEIKKHCKVQEDEGAYNFPRPPLSDYINSNNICEEETPTDLGTRYSYAESSHKTAFCSPATAGFSVMYLPLP